MQKAVKQLEDEMNRFKGKTISEKDLETLQRYADLGDYGVGEESDGEYVRWDALIQLLK